MLVVDFLKVVEVLRDNARTRPAAARIVSRVSGIAMVGIGLFLVVERMLHLA